MKRCYRLFLSVKNNDSDVFVRQIVRKILKEIVKKGDPKDKSIK
ncbi:hypothetical protein RR45_GL000897 [Lactococcus chungangensis CAU 28 = DSM 22330]|uniref:Uncharacterized protein n=1 Tax=Pseudolactococcus chungangensis CAU 28 = DSM 22330 TaxID=1122154 RepID=A0ABX4I973_9LACT|nr:hypothetical protein RR45_GL000897 [Lactococcus chungangensis CAU 28 = DSM 22330]